MQKAAYEDDVTPPPSPTWTMQMRDIVRLAARVCDLITTAMAVLAGGLFVAAAIIVLVEVISRYFFRSPILGAVEITEYCLLWMTFLGAPWLQARNGNVRVEFLVDYLKPSQRSLILAIGSIVSVAVCLLITAFGIVAVWDQYDMGYMLSTPLRPPGALVMSVIPIGCFFLAIQFARQAHKYWAGLK